jgi:hypothetical protein
MLLNVTKFKKTDPSNSQFPARDLVLSARRGPRKHGPLSANRSLASSCNARCARRLFVCQFPVVVPRVVGPGEVDDDLKKCGAERWRASRAPSVPPHTRCATFSELRCDSQFRFSGNWLKSLPALGKRILENTFSFHSPIWHPSEASSWSP